MARYDNQTLSGDVTLDGNVYADCEFLKARMIYNGGTPPQFINTRFTESHFAFDKAAGNTVSFLRAMLPPQSNMRQVVFGLMPELNQVN